MSKIFSASWTLIQLNWSSELEIDLFLTWLSVIRDLMANTAGQQTPKTLETVTCYRMAKEILLKYIPIDRYWKKESILHKSVSISLEFALWFSQLPLSSLPSPWNRWGKGRCDGQLEDTHPRLTKRTSSAFPSAFSVSLGGLIICHCYWIVLYKIMLMLSHSLEDWHNYVILLYHN